MSDPSVRHGGPASPRSRVSRGCRALGGLLCLLAAPALAQEADTLATRQALRVFVDCQGRFCDEDFIRREVPYVNYTRDRQDAQVHVLVTSQQTGGGGRRFTLDFLGREGFEGMDDRLEFSTRANLSEEEILSELARSIGLGLARYVARTPTRRRVRLLLEEGEGEDAGVATQEDDPWDFWVFRVRGNGSYQAEERVEGLSVSGGLSANRITEAHKLQLSASGRYRESDFEVDDTTTVKSVFRNYDFFGRAVWSLGPHWSAGFETSVRHSTFSNEDLAIRVAPAVEYDIFPYSESQRRLLTLRGSIGVARLDWIEETVFFETEETRVDSRLTVSLDVKEPWGEAGAALEAVALVDEPARNRVALFGRLDLRITRGLSFDIFGSVSRVRDQINLPAGEATQEEVLLRQRELATGFEYRLSVGFSYTFGSIFSNVVNPRFGGSGRGGFFFF